MPFPEREKTLQATDLRQVLIHLGRSRRVRVVNIGQFLSEVAEIGLKKFYEVKGVKFTQG